MKLPALIVALACGACATSSPVGKVRFANRAPVWTVNDRLDVPTKPKERAFANYLYHLDGFFVRPLTRFLEVPDPHRALNTNALDEVPDSTWFTNRIGVRDMSVDEVRQGPNEAVGPEQHKPWKILGTKVGGVSVGFLIKDARGQRYLLKFDAKGHPEVETAADIIVQRLFWAAGYNTPEDRIVHFEREDLLVAEDASVKDTFGNKRKMTQADLEERLGKINIEPGKPIRGMVSKFLPGIPIGGYAREGLRKDDPNDLIAHQHRRDVRGMHAMCSWLGHTDVKEGNTLDIWAEDPTDPERHYVVHYLVDFGKSLGTLALMGSLAISGFSYSTDLGVMVKTLPTFGLWKRPWDGIEAPGIPGIGVFEAERFSPGNFSTHTPYMPFDTMDRFDGFWGAKIVMRFTPAQIRAVVEEADYTDPRAVEYMVETLLARQKKVGRYWFQRVNPLDTFTVEARPDGTALCFDDLSVVHGLQPASAASYAAAGFEHGGRANGWRGSEAGVAGGRVCLTGLKPGARSDGYVMVRIVTRHGGRNLPGVVVHLARDSGGSLRVVGIRRQ